MFLLAAFVALVSGCGGGERPPEESALRPAVRGVDCPLGFTVEVELEAWQERLESSAEAEGYRLVLGELGFEPLPDRTLEEPEPEQGAMTLVSAEVTDLRRGGGAAADRLVTARFRNAAGAESLRALVLRPLPDREGSYCSLGDHLSHERESGEEPCIEEHPGPARSLSVENLLAPDRDSIVARDAGGWCGSGRRRGDRFSTSFWGVELGRLVKYFEAVTSEAWYESPDPPSEIRRGEIELSESWPRTITYTEVVECRSPDEEAMPDDGCRPFERTETHRYVDGRYVELDDPRSTAEGRGRVETQEVPR